jgi:DNA repair exonuclease SbcCD ATPase subunit
MRLLSARLSNFGSYRNLHIDFNNKGLTLLSGPTGAGKSTLCDVVPWILFGKTAKGGTVDEVVRWGSDDITSGQLFIEIKGETIEIFRSRNPNDLWVTSKTRVLHRGKDLNDTQKIINTLLNMDLDTYLSGAYFHEFSETAAFFTANAKTRRTITEQLVDLSLAVKINEGAAEYRKELKAESIKNTSELEKLQARISELDKHVEEYINRSKAWEIKKKDKIRQLTSMATNFDTESKLKHLEISNRYMDSIKDLEGVAVENAYYDSALSKLDEEILACGSEVCPACGNHKSNPRRMVLMKKQCTIVKEQSTNAVQLTRLAFFKRQLETHLKTKSSEDNPYIEQVTSAKEEINPYNDSALQGGDILMALKDAAEELQGKQVSTRQELQDTELLLDIVSEFRIKLIKSTVQYIESLTNKLLQDYFDAEIRVEFSVESADKLEVSIAKDGHISTFTQLSKGQRQLLKLTFGVAVMQAISNRKGISFNTIFLDEFADGLDENMKTKSFRLLEYLSTIHESVFAIDHSESLKTMFANRWNVYLENGESHIEEA